MPLEKEKWLPIIKEQYDEETSFLNEVQDHSDDVDNNILHLADAGVDPSVLYNNSSYPVPIAPRADTPVELPLATFDTENTVVRNLEKRQLAYNKMASVTRRHAAALKNDTAFRATHDLSPANDGINSPVLATTGNQRETTSKKMITQGDVLRLARAFDGIAPGKSKTLVLNHLHYYDLLETSPILQAQMGNMSKVGEIPKMIYHLYGFKIYMYNGRAVYNLAGVKQAYGTAYNPASNSLASFAFVNDAVMKAEGSQDMFATLMDPEQRGDIVGFQKRFVALPYTGKYIASIYDAQN